jgi:transposase
MLIVEVDRLDRRARRAHGKSDPLDAYSAARAALSGAAAVVPKLRNGRVEAIRALRVARSSAAKARSQAMNQIKSLIVTGHLPSLKMIAACARLGPGHQLGDTAHAVKTALRRLARRHQQLSEEITEADQELDQLVHQVAPALLALRGVGPEVAGQVLITTGDNLDRIKSEAAFARLCGAAPIPASSGRTHDTGSIAAVTVEPTMRSTLSFLAGSATTHAPAPTPSAEPMNARRSSKSSAA